MSEQRGILDHRGDSFARPMMEDLERRTRQARAQVPPEVTAALGARYTIEGVVGSGGMATVYLAFDTSLGRRVAVKVLRPELADGIPVERFELEIATAARLDHPRIVPVYDRGGSNGVLYYVLRYVDGESLRDRLDKRRHLEIQDAIGIARHVAEALHHAHAHQVVHRDIKPENILLDENGAYVTDFGIARIQDAVGLEHLTLTGIAVGTAPYMSPEQIEASPAIDGRSDVYSLACVLYEMLAGEPPYTGRAGRDILAKHLAAAIPDLSVVRPTVNRQMQHVMVTGLQKTAVDRFPSARQLVDEFERAYKATTESPPTAPPRGRTIAVLPFANMSGDAANDYFSDGIAEELIGLLTRAGAANMRVVARTSSFAFKGQQRDIREIGVVLGATHVLEGSVRIAGRRLRATAQLVDASSGHPLWSERYDRDLEDVFDVQDEITNAIATRLQRELEPPPSAIVREDARFGSSRYSGLVEHSAVGSDPIRQALIEALGAEYEIGTELGRGAVCVVYKGRDLATSDDVAIKTLLPGFANASYRARLLRETQVAMRLKHPNIVPIFAVKDTPTVVGFVMEFISGRTLSDVMRDAGQMPVNAAIMAVRDMGNALAHAHEQKVLHHDLRPQKVMVRRGRGRAIVMDFGLAVAWESENLTAVGTVIGTPSYMSPERFHSKHVGPASDQYSLGAIAYEMLAGQPPFSGATFSEMITGHLFQAPPDVRLLRPDVSRQVADAISRMLAKESTDRFPDCLAAVEALGAVDDDVFARAELAELVSPPPPQSSAEALGGPFGAARRPVTAPRARFKAKRTMPIATLPAMVLKGVWGWLVSLVRTEKAARPAIVRGTPTLTPSNLMAPEQRIIRQRFPAYDAYLRGRFLLNFESSSNSLADAVRHFDEAIAGNQSFAPAYAARAYARTMLARANVAPAAELRTFASSDAATALRLEPALAEAHVATGLVAMFFDWDAKGALAALDRAVQTSPVYADAHMWRGSALNWLQGEPAKAIATLDRALDLDPLSLVTRVELAFAHLLKGDREQALHEADAAVASGLLLGAKPRGNDKNQPRAAADGFAAAHYARAVVLVELGRFDEAVAEAREACRVGGRQTTHLALLGMAQALGGDRDAARLVIEELEGRARTGGTVSTALATVHVGLKDPARALDALAAAYDDREVNLVFAAVSPHFSSLRGDPRFAELMSKIRA